MAWPLSCAPVSQSDLSCARCCRVSLRALQTKGCRSKGDSVLKTCQRVEATVNHFPELCCVTGGISLLQLFLESVGSKSRGSCSGVLPFTWFPNRECIPYLLMQWLFAQVVPFPPNSPFSRIKALVCFFTSSLLIFFLTSIALSYLSLWLCVSQDVNR